jgi:hypothetical protein
MVYRLDALGSILLRNRRLFFIAFRSALNPNCLLQKGPRGPFEGIKWLRHEVDYSVTSSVEVEL